MPRSKERKTCLFVAQLEQAEELPLGAPFCEAGDRLFVKFKYRMGAKPGAHTANLAARYSSTRRHSCITSSAGVRVRDDAHAGHAAPARALDPARCGFCVWNKPVRKQFYAHLERDAFSTVFEKRGLRFTLKRVAPARRTREERLAAGKINLAEFVEKESSVLLRIPLIWEDFGKTARRRARIGGGVSAAAAASSHADWLALGADAVPVGDGTPTSASAGAAAAAAAGVAVSILVLRLSCIPVSTETGFYDSPETFAPRYRVGSSDDESVEPYALLHRATTPGHASDSDAHDSDPEESSSSPRFAVTDAGCDERDTASSALAQPGEHDVWLGGAHQHGGGGGGGGGGAKRRGGGGVHDALVRLSALGSTEDLFALASHAGVGEALAGGDRDAAEQQRHLPRRSTFHGRAAAPRQVPRHVPLAARTHVRRRSGAGGPADVTAAKSAVLQELLAVRHREGQLLSLLSHDGPSPRRAARGVPVQSVGVDGAGVGGVGPGGAASGPGSLSPAPPPPPAAPPVEDVGKRAFKGRRKKHARMQQPQPQQPPVSSASASPAAAAALSAAVEAGCGDADAADSTARSWPVDRASPAAGPVLQRMERKNRERARRKLRVSADDAPARAPQGFCERRDPNARVLLSELDPPAPRVRLLSGSLSRGAGLGEGLPGGAAIEVVDGPSSEQVLHMDLPHSDAEVSHSDAEVTDAAADSEALEALDSSGYVDIRTSGSGAPAYPRALEVRARAGPLPPSSGVAGRGAGVSPAAADSPTPAAASSAGGASASASATAAAISAAAAGTAAALHRSASDLAAGAECLWNSQFQTCLEMTRAFSVDTPFQQRQRVWAHLANLADDFNFTAKTYAKIIIHEKHLREAQRTIRPRADMGGVVGGEKYLVNGVVFKFALDIRHLFSGAKHPHEVAAKIAGHDLKGLTSWYNCDVRGLSFPMMSLIDYGGFRVVAVSYLPIDRDTIVYGSADGGRTVHCRDETLARRVEQGAQILNCKPHRCKRCPHVLASPADLEGHVGRDGRFYLVDFSRTWPPEAPERGDKTRAYLYRHLRGEFVRTFPRPLNPDVFSGFCEKDAQLVEDQRDVELATHVLQMEVIPRFALELTDVAPDSRFPLVHRLHRVGINLRYLGLLRGHVTSPFCRAVLLLEMAARVIKVKVRRRWRKALLGQQTSGVQPLKSACVAILNRVFGEGKASDDWWKGTLKAALAEKFPMALRGDELDAEYSLKRSLLPVDNCMLVLFAKVSTMLGLRFQQAHRFEENDLVFQTPEPLDESDLVEVVEVLKHMHVFTLAQGFVLRTKMQMHPENAARFRDMAIRKFEIALTSMPVLRTTYLVHLADLYRKRGDSERANDCFVRALQLDPRDPRTCYRYATFLASSPSCGSPQLAERYYRMALHLEPNWIDALQGYAWFCTEHLQRPDEADQLYRRALEICEERPGKESKLAACAHNYGLFLVKRGDVDYAGELLKRAVDLQPNHPLHLKNYAWFLVQVRRDREGAERVLLRLHVQKDRPPSQQGPLF